MLNKISKKIIAKSYRDIANSVSPIDDEERELLNSWKNTTEDDIVDLDKEEEAKFKKEFLSAQKEFKHNSKSQTMTIRLNNDIKDKIKQKADFIGLNYQTYINMILFQVANDRIKISI